MPPAATQPGESVAAEARRRVEDERRRVEQEMLDQSRHEAGVAEEARRRLAVERIKAVHGRTFAVLLNPDTLAELMVRVGLATVRITDRVNPNGTITKLTTTTVPALRTVDCSARVVVLQFDGVVGTSLATWTAASDLLRSGLCARSITVTEPAGGLFRLDLEV